MIYFDTSYLARLYLEDNGWAEVRTLSETCHVACSLHGKVETAAAIHRACRERRHDVATMRRLMDQFQSDCASGGFHWFPLHDALIDSARAAYRPLEPEVFLRAADALHLACARDNGFREIYSNDARLLAAAPVFGLKGRNVLP